MPAPGPNVGQKTKAGADSGSRPGRWCGESTGEGRELPGGPVTSRKPAGTGHSGTPLRTALSLILDLSPNPKRVRLLAQSPRCPLGPRATWIRPGLQWAGHTRGPPGPSCRRAEATLSRALPARSPGFCSLSPLHPPGSRAAPLGRSGQPTADLPTPVLAGQVASFQRMVFPSCLQVGRAAPHQKGKNDTF